MSRALVFSVLGILIVSACTPSVESPRPSASDGTVATSHGPTSAPSAAAPSPTASDVSDLFVARVAATTSATLTIDGSLAIGSQVSPVTGSITFVDGDSEETLAIGSGRLTSIITVVHRAGSGFSRHGSGPWIEDAIAPETGSDLGSWLPGITTVVDTGVEVHDGLTAHRLRLPPGTAVPAEAFDMVDRDMVDPGVELVLYAADDGRPIALAPTITWTRIVDGQATPVQLALDLRYVQVGDSTIAVPDHAWHGFSSKRYGFSIAYPESWVADTSQKGHDYLKSLTVARVGARRLKSDDLSLSAWAAKLIAVHEAAPLDYTLLTNEPFVLGGVAGRMLTSTYYDYGQKLICYEVVAVQGGYAYNIFWISPARTRVSDLVIYRQMLETYTIT